MKTPKTLWVNIINSDGEVVAGGILGAIIEGGELNLLVRNPYSGSEKLIDEFLEVGAQIRVEKTAV